MHCYNHVIMMCKLFRCRRLSHSLSLSVVPLGCCCGSSGLFYLFVVYFKTRLGGSTLEWFNYTKQHCGVWCGAKEDYTIAGCAVKCAVFMLYVWGNAIHTHTHYYYMFNSVCATLLRPFYDSNNCNASINNFVYNKTKRKKTKRVAILSL